MYSSGMAVAPSTFSSTIPLSTNKHLIRWVEKMADLTKPANIHWVDGSDEENEFLCSQMVAGGTFTKLNEKLWPGCYYARSDASDVARVEDRTFICSLSKDSAGPTNNWVNPFEMRRKLKALFRGCMRGRTMYVLPFSMGPIGSPMSQIGVQLTDSPYVVVNMRIMARIGLPVFQRDRQGRSSASCPACTASARRLRPGEADVPWPCNKEKYIVHFPETREIWSYGSGYGGNALLGKKCFALRIASNIARDEGWMAEHMLILGVENPQGEKTYVAAAFPSACGKTNFAMLIPPEGFEGWKVWTVGDDIAWIKPGRERPPAGDQSRSRLLRRRAGHVREDESERDGDAVTQHDLHQRRADARGRRVVGRHDGRAARRVPRLAGAAAGRRRSARKPARRPRIRTARFTAPASQCPTIDPAWEDPEGRADQRDHLRRPPRHDHAAGLSGVQLERRRLCRRDDGLGDDGRGRGRGGQGAPRSDGDAAVLRLSHGRLLPALAQDAALAQRDAAHFPRELVPQRCERQFPVAGLQREHAGAEVDRRSGARAARWAAKRRSAGCRVTRTSTGTAWISRKRSLTKLQAFDRRAWRAEVIGHEELFIDLHDHLPPEMIYERELLICRL